MLIFLSLIFAAAGFITLWPRYFADASLTFTLSSLAALVLIGMFAGVALTLMLDSNASAGGQP
jgi:uncharacterized membrane-anchored protein YitT (DUF2179 family)